MYKQIHTPTVVEEGEEVGGGGGGMEPHPGFLICCSLLKRFYL